MAVNKKKGLWVAAVGGVVAALPYLPKITAALDSAGASPKLVSVLTAATIIYQAFKADPHKTTDPGPAARTEPQNTDCLPKTSVAEAPTVSDTPDAH